MILSAGLTPAWQQILVFDSFRYGEVNRAAEVHWCASGKVFNAGIGVHHLGVESLTLATAGGPPLMQIRAEMESLGVPLEVVETESATRVLHDDPRPQHGHDDRTGRERATGVGRGTRPV